MTMPNKKERRQVGAYKQRKQEKPKRAHRRTRPLDEPEPVEQPVDEHEPIAQPVSEGSRDDD